LGEVLVPLLRGPGNNGAKVGQPNGLIAL
jgi:hypothetical protein